MYYSVIKHPSQDIYKCLNINSIEFADYMAADWEVVFTGYRKAALDYLQNLDND